MESFENKSNSFHYVEIRLKSDGRSLTIDIWNRSERFILKPRKSFMQFYGMDLSSADRRFPRGYFVKIFLVPLHTTGFKIHGDSTLEGPHAGVA